MWYLLLKARSLAGSTFSFLFFCMLSIDNYGGGRLLLSIYIYQEQLYHFRNVTLIFSSLPLT